MEPSARGDPSRCTPHVVGPDDCSLGTQVEQNSARVVEACPQDPYGMYSYASNIVQQLPLQSDYGVVKQLEFVESGLERNRSPLIKQERQHSLEIPSPWQLNHTPTSASAHCSHPLMKSTRVYSPPPTRATQLFPGEAEPIFVESPFLDSTQRQQPCPPLPPRAVVPSYQHSYPTSLQSSHPPSNETSVSSPSTHVPETPGPTAAIRRYSPSNRLKETPNVDEPACSMQSASLNMAIPASLPMRERIHEKRARELQSGKVESELFQELVHSLMGSFHRPQSTSSINPTSKPRSPTMSVAKSESSERVAFTPPDSPPPSEVISTSLQSSLGRNQTSLPPTNPEIKSPSTELNKRKVPPATVEIPSSSVSRTITAPHSPACRATTRKLRVPVYSQFKHPCYTASQHIERHEFAAPSLTSSSIHFPSTSGFHRRDEYSFEDFEEVALDTYKGKKGSTASIPSKSTSTYLGEQKLPGARVDNTKRQRRQESSLDATMMNESNAGEMDTPRVKAANLAERISLRRARKANFIRIEPLGISNQNDDGGGGGDGSPATPTCVVKPSDDGVQGSVPKLVIKLGARRKTSGEEDAAGSTTGAVATLAAARGGKKVEMTEESDSDWEFPAKRYKKSGKKRKKREHRDHESPIPCSSSKYTQPEKQPSQGDVEAEASGEGLVTPPHLDCELKAEEMRAMERLKFFECSVHSDMPKGTFLVAKEDAFNEHCCLWKIDSANLLQKYIPMVDVNEDNDATRRMHRYRSVSAFTGWCPSTAANYIAVEVDQLSRSRSEAVVQPKYPIDELLPACSVSADDNFEQAALTTEAPETPCRGRDRDMANTIEEPIRLFLEAMLRHACSLNFIQTVKAENDFRYLNALNEVDRRNSESKEKIKGHIKLCGPLERSLQTYAGYYGATEHDGEFAHQISTYCQNCACSDATKLRLALLFGNLINEDSGDVAPSVDGGPENNLLRTGTPPSTEDIVLCEVCEWGASLYHKLHHMPYQVFKKCEDQLEAIGTRNPDLDQEEAIIRCVNDNAWSQEIILVYESAWRDASGK